MDAKRRLDGIDVAVVVCLLGATGLYATTCLAWTLHPFEDSAMLMRYAQHLAEGHGIVWNIGEAPVDGATDFLFMVVVAGLARCGLRVETAVRVVGVLSHYVTVAMVYLAVRRLHGAGRWVAALSAGYLAVGPGLRFVAAYFGTPFFVLALTAAWWLASELAEGRGGRWMAPAFALAGLTMGLIRPEGVFLTLFLVVAVACRRGRIGARPMVLWTVGVFAVLGGAYFAWRWHYFGHPLPNPFYKKGGGRLYWDGLKWAVRSAVTSCLPFGLAYVAALRSRAAMRRALFSALPAGLFVALWLLLSPEGNYFGRFQYAVLPLVLISWPGLLEGLRADWRLPALGDLGRRPRQAAVVALAVAAAAALVYHHRLSRMPIRARDGRYRAATLLGEYRERGYTLAVSEAGLLPFYSRWRAVDTWGLNDAWIAHHGAVTAEYLDRHRPEVIMFHAYFSPIASEGRTDAWNAMVTTLKEYAEARGYVHAAAFGESPYDCHHYYVRPGFPDSQALAVSIRELDYTWMSSGRRCVNYAVLRRP